MPDMIQPYPLKLSALPKEKVWGGPNLARLFPATAAGGTSIGEIWLVWDRLQVSGGAWQGQTLAEVVHDQPAAILGSRQLPGPGAVFPLLVKLVDAQDMLSVQVHPDDAYAQQHEREPFGKSEVWVILDAEPGARLIYGLQRPLSRAELQAAIANGELRHILNNVPVAPGDVILNPPGTIHALGKGIVVYELQQSSDLTYRLYDWDRNDPNRPLHIAQSLDVADREPPAEVKIRPITLHEPGASRALLCATRYFAAELLTVQASLIERPAGHCFHALTALQGTLHLRDLAAPEVAYPLAAGESILVPAAIERYELQAEHGQAAVIKGYVPDLGQDVVSPLVARGVPWTDIVQLGGDPRRSDLQGYEPINKVPGTSTRT